MLLILRISLVILLFRPIPVIDDMKIFTSASLSYPSEYNYIQTYNDCAPFNVAAVIRVLTNENVSSAEFAKTIGWRLKNKYTLPMGLEDQLKENNITIEVPNLLSLTENERIIYLKEQLSSDHPVILLIGIDGFQHYITLLGFDSVKREFYFYDSIYKAGEVGLTIDDNGESPGNRTFTTQDLLDHWSKGGMYGMYKWYVLSSSI